MVALYFSAIMHRYVAFLRGMNLGRRRIKNLELCAVFEGMGFESVAAFLASGNVVFEAEEGDAGVVAEMIEVGLQRALGYEVPTFLRSADEVRVIAGYEPFSGFSGERSGKLQVAMLKDAPRRPARDSVLGMACEEDMLEVVGRELYWWPEENLSSSELDLKAVEGILGPMTIRTKGTIERLTKRFLSE